MILGGRGWRSSRCRPPGRWPSPRIGPNRARAPAAGLSIRFTDVTGAAGIHVPSPQRRVRQEVPARDDGVGLRLRGRRRRRLAGRRPRAVDGLARPRDGRKRTRRSTGTTATAPSPTSRARRDWRWRCTGSASPRRTSTTTATPTSTSRRSVRAACSATTDAAASKTSPRRPASAIPGSRRAPCGSTTTATAGSTCSSPATSQWSIEKDLFCSLDGRTKSYCTPEAYKGQSPVLYRNSGDGTFENVTKKAGLDDPANKMLGVALIDYDGDGRLDVFGANDTQPNRLYRNKGDGTFADVGVMAGVAFNEAGVARAGMGVDAADYDGSGRQSLVIGNFSNEMMALYSNEGNGLFIDEAPALDDRPRVAAAADVRVLLRRRRSRRPARHLRRQRPRRRRHRPRAADDHLRAAAAPLPQSRREEVRGRQHAAPARRSPRRSSAAAPRTATTTTTAISTCSSRPTTAPRASCATTAASNHRLRVTLVGHRVEPRRHRREGPRRPAGAGSPLWRMVKTGSSYLSQSELPLTFGLGAAVEDRRASRSRGRTARPSASRPSRPIRRSRSRKGKASSATTPFGAKP